MYNWMQYIPLKPCFSCGQKVNIRESRTGGGFGNIPDYEIKIYCKCGICCITKFEYDLSSEGNYYRNVLDFISKWNKRT